MFKILRRLNQLDFATIIACVHYCAVLNKKQRKDFQKVYGTKTDENITNIMMKLSE